jgi:CDP-diacylglycerol--glycerol-3-phosphate 3-phosphatidyltransferase
MAMNNSAHAAASGLYSFKSWYARRLAPVRRHLVAANVPPSLITMTGICFGAGAGAVLALMRPGPAAGAAVAALLAARLACANLDGGVARDGDRATPFGAVLNEIGDRAAELAVLAGCLALAPAALVLAAALAATLPSWVALAGAAAGLGRIQGGPVGKTERCLLLALIAAIGWPVALLWLLAVGSALTAAVRLARLAWLARLARVRQTQSAWAARPARVRQAQSAQAARPGRAARVTRGAR